MKRTTSIIVVGLFLSSCSTFYSKKDVTTEKADRLELLIKIIGSSDNKILFSNDMKNKFLNYSRYDKDELIKISDALTKKIEKLTKVQKQKLQKKQGSL